MLLPLMLLAISFPAGGQEAGAPAGGGDDDREVLLSEPDDTSTPAPSGQIEEMVVLASGRDDFLKDLSVSATSFSTAEIKALRIQNIADLAEYTPNLEINTRSAASNPTLFIRGIGLKDYNANAAGAVSVYRDGININSPAIQLGQLFDIEEIVVLRGPQGSLNGRNATAGAIMMNSVLPDGQREAWGSVSYGNYNYVNVEGAVSLPIVEDLLSTRVAFTTSFRDGTTRNNCANWDPESVGSPVLDEQSLRDALEWNLDQGNNLKKQFPRATSDANRIETDSQGRPLVPDNVCIWDSPGQFDSLDGKNIKDASNVVWVPNEDPNTTTVDTFQGLKRDVNDIKNWAARGILRFQPDVSEGMDWILNVHGGQNLADAYRLQSLRSTYIHNGGDPVFVENVAQPSSEALAALNSDGIFEGIRTVDGLQEAGSDQNDRIPGGRGGADIDAGFYDLDGLELLDSAGFSLQGLWNTGPVNVTSLTGFEWYQRTLEDEGDAVPTNEFNSIYDDSAWQISQELRAQGEGERYRWVVGGFFLYETLEASNLFPGLRSRRIEQIWDQQLTSAAGYLNGRYWLLDEVYFDGGFRYNYENKSFTLESTLNALDGGSSAQIEPQTVDETWTAPTGEVVLGWEPGGDWMYDARMDHLNLYAKYGRGFKGGHFNAGLTTQANVAEPQRIEVVDPEYINAFEVGFKSRWLQNRLVMNFAWFRYWYEDLQVFDFTNEKEELPIQKLLNSDADVMGVELELQARPLPGLLLQFSGGWLDSEFIDFKVFKATTQSRAEGNLVEFDYSGHPLIAAPEWNASGVVEYQIPLGEWGSLVPQYTISYRSKVYLDPQMLDPISQEPILVQNARLAYRTPDGRYEAALWVENFTEERYKSDVFDLSLGENSIIEVWNEPRMFGITISAYY